MMEELKLIMEALNGFTEGALWAFAGYLIYKLMTTFLILSAFLFFIIKGAELIRVAIRPKCEVNNWNMYQWDERGAGRISALFSSSEMKALLKEMADKDGLVTSGSLSKAIIAVREARDK